MQNNDRPEFAKLMKVLGETFGNTVPSKEKMEIYFRALSDMPIEKIDEAVLNLVNTRTITSTFPVPAEIRNAVGGKSEDLALLALDKAEKAVEKHGTYSSVVFDDPIIHMVIGSMGGWPAFCSPATHGDEREWHWIQKDFCRLYQVFAKNPKSEFPKTLVGECTGILATPKIVGNEQKALEWQEKHSQKKIDGGVKSLMPEMGMR
jgi:hypothetical protein